MKILFSENFKGKDLAVIKKLLLMITIVVHGLKNMNQLKNGLDAQRCKVWSIATVSFIDNGQWN